MKYLVTGGAGFIGSCLAKSLLAKGHEVYILDNLSTGFLDNVPEKAVFKKGSVFGDDIQEFKNVIFDAIFHIAGQSSGEISFSDPMYDLHTNTESTLNLLQFAKRTGCKKFIYASTMSVYGSVPDQAITEDHATMPLSFYGVGKIASEHYLRIYQQEYGINTCALRLFNVYGPGQNMKNMRQGMISIFMSYALKNEPIHIKGSGQRYRDFVFIDDVVKAFEVALEKNLSGVFNIGTGQKTLIQDLVPWIIRAVGKDSSSYPYFFEGSTPGDQFGIYSSSKKFSQASGWLPKVQLHEGLTLMADWAKKQTF